MLRRFRRSFTSRREMPHAIPPFAHGGYRKKDAAKKIRLTENGNTPTMTRVLIVDDEPGIRSLLSLAFARGGYEVRTAASPLEAMEICNSEQFDAVLSDVHMPGMDGHALIQWVAKNYPAVRTVLMSAYDLHCAECPFAGRCTLIRKPFNPKDAVKSVAGALASAAN